MSAKNKNYDKKIFRLTYILNKMDSGERVSTRVLAEEFNVCLRTVQRDIELLNVAGFPLISSGEGCHSFMKGFSLKKMSLSGEEASLLSFLHEVTKSLGGAFEGSFRNILKKAITEKYGSPFYMKVPEGMKVDKEYPFLKVLEEAISDNRKIFVHYTATETGKEGDYRLCPLKIIFYDGFWYLLSQTEDKAILPKFRLENIKSVKILDDYFEPPENLMAILNESVNIWFTEKRDKKVTLRVDKDVARYFKQRAYFPLQKIKKKDKNGSLIIETRVAQDEEIIPIIFRWIPHVRVVEPESLMQKVKKRITSYTITG